MVMVIVMVVLSYELTAPGMVWEALCHLWLVIVMVIVMVVLSYELMAPVMVWEALCQLL